MEILSIGEKIKRARVYKGYTLKDICSNKISVSKMSCIENNKIKPENSIIEYVAQKLDVKAEYLKQDVKDQLLNNLSVLKEEKETPDYEEKLEYNLGYAEEYKYYDVAFNIMHLLITYYFEKEQIEKLQLNTSKYYEISQKSNMEENLCTYYMDVGRYFFLSKEYDEAANYYNNVRKIARGKDDYKLLARATYNETACNFMLEKYERAYEIGVHLTDFIEYFETDIKKADAYHILALLALRRDKGKFDFYEKCADELFKDNYCKKALAAYNYAVFMFKEGLNEKGEIYIKKGLKLYPKDNKENLVRFMLMNVEALVETDLIDTAQCVCSEALDYAITLDDNKYIEKAYYFKAVILEKTDNFYSAETYMNLSLDSLLKAGTKPDICKRYTEMGNMYYKMGQTAESIKYFNLAIDLKNKM